ncbi:hypothetical protein CERSUDRAFT_87394 [Gelatoporia subvermispora B]|uniref:Uncharacterized protein n=1 Tax=Ceriporiopsis subvermispora (strain B) TaxID=914234 RepID=M2PBS6_CERS8|nr:hypothetical protein CERSUDRAFT_87394 [Gelatoporia subvermispora B]
MHSRRPAVIKMSRCRRGHRPEGPVPALRTLAQCEEQIGTRGSRAEIAVFAKAGRWTVRMVPTAPDPSRGCGRADPSWGNMDDLLRRAFLGHPGLLREGHTDRGTAQHHSRSVLAAAGRCKAPYGRRQERRGSRSDRLLRCVHSVPESCGTTMLRPAGTAVRLIECG